MSSNTTFTQTLHDWAETFMRRSFRDFKHFMDDSGLSPSQINALMRLHHCESCGVSDIGDHLGITNAAASQLVDRLVQQHLLQRSEDPHDRRYKLVALTPDGKSLIQEGIQARSSWMVQLTEALTAEEQQKIIEALTLLTQAARQLETETEHTK
jgi:DNA-binding MarR family transcriptional regulator